MQKHTHLNRQLRSNSAEHNSSSGVVLQEGHIACPLPPLERYKIPSMTLGYPLVGVVMGSRSDFETMQHALSTLEALYVPFEVRVLSAHRTPNLLQSYATSAQEREFRCIIAGAGGAAHLPGMLAAFTRVPILGVPVQSKALAGLDSLYSIVQMPAGIPVATFAIGKAGAVNAALFAAAICASEFIHIRDALEQFRQDQTRAVLDDPHFEGYPAAPTGENTNKNTGKDTGELS